MRRESFLADRITELRMQKGVTESRMSRDLGRGTGYVNRITTGRGYPGYEELMHICNYLGVTPAHFFCAAEDGCPKRGLPERMNRLSAEELQIVENIVDSILKNHQKD